MNSFKFILILLNVVASAWNIAIEAWGFAALSGGLALLLVADAICDAIKGAKS